MMLSMCNISQAISAIIDMQNLCQSLLIK